jgi:demethylmenaquinone methyltransferase/2-methoxy-6-polyprenyl-1,4-benzoquinol methylase
LKTPDLDGITIGEAGERGMGAKRDRYRWFYDHVHCHFYDFVTGWCFLPLGGEAKVRRTLVDVIGIRQGDRVLDVCCGTGGTTALIAARVGETSPVIAIDLSKGQIRVAKKKHPLPNVEFRVMDASNTSFDSGCFDKVVISHALHEMPRGMRLEVLKEARRIIRDGGIVAALEMDTPQSPLRRLLIGLWWFYWLPFNPETATRRDMLKHGLLEELRQAGLSHVSRAGLFGGTLQVVKGTKRAAGPPKTRSCR